MKKYYIANRLFFIILIFTNLQIFAEYDDFAIEFFSGRQPSARAEAMGKVKVMLLLEGTFILHFIIQQVLAVLTVLCSMLLMLHHFIY